MTARSVRRGSVLLGGCLVACAAVWTAPVIAQDGCLGRSEPDDLPESAPGVSGAFCVAAELTPEDQDLLLWEVPAGSGATVWRITLTGVEGTLTSLRLFAVTSAPGVVPVSVGSQLAILDSPPQAVAPVTLPDLLLSEGRYLIGVSRTDRPDGARPWSFDYAIDVGAAALPAAAERVAGDFSLSGRASLTEPSVVRWTVPEGAPDEAWSVEALGTLGVPLTLYLETDEGASLTTAYNDPLGRVVMPDLVLSPGTYRLRASATTEASSPFRLAAASAPPVADPEPNDLPERAVAFDLAEPIARGRIWPAVDRDHYRFEVPADVPSRLLDIRVVSPEGRRRSVCLWTEDGVQLQCRDGTTTVRIGDLLLASGTYVVSVSGDADVPAAADGTSGAVLEGYVLRVDTTSAPAPDFETEPNDDPPRASAFDPSTLMRGRGTLGDQDVFRVTLAGQPRLWEAVASGPGIDRLAWVRGDGTVLGEGRPDAAGAPARVTDMYLVPGEHLVRIAASGDYELRLTPLGPPDPNAEREPNDAAAFAEPLRLSRTHVVGRLAAPQDRDVFRFSLAGQERVAITATPATAAAIELGIETRRTTVARARPAERGKPSSLDLLLGPGDYEVILADAGGETGDGGRYELRLERGSPLAPRDDAEPNDIVERASPVGPDLVVRGTGSSHGDVDWYALPPVEPGAQVRVSLAGAADSAAISDGRADLPSQVDGATGALTADTSSGLTPRAVRLIAYGDYEAVIEVDGLEAVPEPPPLPVRITVTPRADAVAAYWPSGQRIMADVELTNDGRRPVELSLEALTSHYGWSVTLEDTVASLLPGETASLPIAIVAQPDAWADEPVLIHIAAHAPDGATVTTSTAITPRRDVGPVGPEAVWPLPEALLGGLDVASQALGATTLPSLDPTGEAQLHDGFAMLGLGFATSTASLPITLTVDLAGDEPIPIAGTIIDPLGIDAVPGDVPTDFELLLSRDGVTFTPVLSGRLSTLMAEQAFVLAAPVEASFAQLRVLGVHGGGFDRAVLGEWKVVAVPGAVPDGAAFAAAEDHGSDLARQAAGGHVSWIDPQVQDPAVPVAMVDADPTVQSLWVEPGARLSWAISFRSARAAQVARLVWVDAIGSSPDLRSDEVDVAVSLDGPAGPWRDVGRWVLERGADGRVAPFDLPAGTWARSVRLRLVPPRARVDTGQRELPAAVQVIERAVDGEYRSILGEWGAASPAGPYERFVAPASEPNEDGSGDDDPPSTATPLASGGTATGRATADVDVDWYSITIPEGHNSLLLEVAGRPIVGVAPTLFDADGLRVPMLFEPGERPGTVAYRAEVTPGATYRVEVLQPPSAIVFTYDTSGSVGPYLEDVYHGLRAFSADVTPGRESVLVIPFEEEPLLEGWSDQPYELQNSVDRRIGSGGSSSAETAIIDATTHLSAREGARAILLVTDAESTSYGRSTEMWRALAAVRPLVFAIHIGGSGAPYVSTSSMQDWAISGGGVYRYAGTHGEMDRAFDRLATWLRRPAGYELAVETTFLDEPPASREPGSITVRSAADGSSDAIAPDVGVEIVLDTSGSMLERIGRRRRIDVARDALRELMSEGLPAGTPVALRIFDAAEDGCGTRLAVPLAPLDPEAMVELVDGLVIDRETSTPIAAALERVPDDLAGTDGTGIVVLVTDGEETCEGDAEGAIRGLERRGIDARVNIVGFTVRDRRVRRDMRDWARIGGGSYFDARSAEDLGRAIAQAVRPPFRVLDAAGNEVASGTIDGEPVSIEPGTYSIVVLADPVVRFDGVTVEPGQGVSREMPVEEPEEPTAGATAPTPTGTGTDGG